MIYRIVFGAILRRLSPEQAHDLAFRLLAPLAIFRPLRMRVRRFTIPDDRLIRVRALGFTFPTPLGIAAGLDKNAEHFEQLGALGFGFVEVGTVTPTPQDSNPPPILARIPRDRALLNRMGFPNEGAHAVAARLYARFGETIVGLNVGKNRETPLDAAQADYSYCAQVAGVRADYLVLNISSPNTPGLRQLGAVEQLRPLIAGVQQTIGSSPNTDGTPLLVKISPDMSDDEIDALADLALEMGLAGIIATNTTVNREVLRTPPGKVAAIAWPEGGGVSGAPLKARSLAVLRRLYARTGGRMLLISAGGIENADDVLERMRAGATLVQAYTGFVYGGPLWARKLNFDLARKVWESGADSIEEIIGRESA